VTRSKPKWPPAWFTNLLGIGTEQSASDFVIEAWVAKRWRRIARADNEAAARRLFKQLSYRCPADILIRLRCGSDVLIKMPADGLQNVRE
jgi:hypothetical protein